MLEKKIRVCYYVAGSMANSNAFYFNDEKKARKSMRSSLLTCRQNMKFNSNT